MATKTIVIGEPIEKEKKEPIKFVAMLNRLLNIKTDNMAAPKLFNYIELISKDYAESSYCKDIGELSTQGSFFDLMFAYSDPGDRANGTLFIGHWNDGVVE